MVNHGVRLHSLAFALLLLWVSSCQKAGTWAPVRLGSSGVAQDYGLQALASGSGNGQAGNDGYGRVLASSIIRAYFQLRLGFVCPGSDKILGYQEAVGILEDGSIRYLEDPCVQLDPRNAPTITPDQAESPWYNTQFLGYGKSILRQFNIRSFLPLSTSDGVTEAWCRSVDADGSGVDVLIQTGVDPGPRAWILMGRAPDRQTFEVLPFEVTRSTSRSVVSYSHPDLLLSIDLAQPIEGGNKSSAGWSTTINGRAYSGTIACRTQGLQQ